MISRLATQGLLWVFGFIVAAAVAAVLQLRREVDVITYRQEDFVRHFEALDTQMQRQHERIGALEQAQKAPDPWQHIPLEEEGPR